MNNIERFRYLFIIIFFISPLLIGKVAEECGIADIGIIHGWKDFYSLALGKPNEYALVATLYLLMSPLAILWIHSMANLKYVSIKKSAVLSTGCAVISFVILYLIIMGPPLSSIESPTKGMSLIIRIGRSHVAFCVMYGAFVMSFVAISYVSIVIFFHMIRSIYREMRDGR